MISPEISIFMYHDIRDLDQTRWPARYQQASFIDVGRFERDLDQMARAYTVIPIGQALDGLAGRCVLPPKPAVLTFDDGLLDHKRIAAPILARRGMSGCFFVASQSIEHQIPIAAHMIQFIMAALPDLRKAVELIFNLLDQARKGDPALPTNDSLWQEFSLSQWRDNHWSAEQVFITRLLRQGLAPTLRQQLIHDLFVQHVTADLQSFAADLYMQPDDLGLMVDMGMDLGGHGTDSYDFRTLSSDQARSEMDGALRFITRVVPAYVAAHPIALSYPHGGFDAEIMAMAAECGYAAGLTTQKACARQGDYLFSLPRFDGAQDRPYLADRMA
jgi:peptidoglycan/xylan/chitin deacetylase (PgdA/CDA1 family)